MLFCQLIKPKKLHASSEKHPHCLRAAGGKLHRHHGEEAESPLDLPRDHRLLPNG